MNNKSVNIFLASPMSAVADDKYIEYRKEIIDIISFISNTIKNSIVYYAGKNISEVSHFQNSFLSFSNDIKALNATDIFIFLYPQKSATSALIELGYAIKMAIPIFIIVHERDTLPFMVREIDNNLPNAHIIETGSKNTFLDEFKKNSVIREMLLDFKKK